MKKWMLSLLLPLMLALSCADVPVEGDEDYEQEDISKIEQAATVSPPWQGSLVTKTQAGFTVGNGDGLIVTRQGTGSSVLDSYTDFRYASNFVSARSNDSYYACVSVPGRLDGMSCSTQAGVVPAFRYCPGSVYVDSTAGSWWRDNGNTVRDQSYYFPAQYELPWIQVWTTRASVFTTPTPALGRVWLNCGFTTGIFAIRAN